jgi:hypothetical protein
MQDGRTVVFGSRMKSKKEVISENEIRFDFDNGKSLVFDTRKVSPETLRNLALHGGKQKIGDEGSDADTTEAYEAECRAMVDRLYAGTAFERQGGSGFQDSVLIEALLEVTTQTREEIIATLKGMSTAEKLVVRQVAEVADAIDRINAKRTAGVDTEAVAAKFGLK